MKVTVFGSSGKVGRIVIDELLRRDHKVVAFVHNNSNFPKNDNLTIIKCDIYDAVSVEKAVSGSDAIISTLGSWGTPKKDVLTAGMKNIIPAMQKSGTKRIVSLTGHGANAPGDEHNLLNDFSHWIFSIIAPKILNDGEGHIMLLADSDLNWTVLRSPVMLSFGNPKRAKLTLKRPLPLALINRHSVAMAIVNLADNSDYLKQSPFILRKY